MFTPTLGLKSNSKFKALLENLAKDVAGSHVKVGVLASAPVREDGGKATMAEIALYNEFGVPGRIPERPFLRMTFAAHREEYQQILGRILTTAMGRGQVEIGPSRLEHDIRTGLGRLGLKVAGHVQAMIHTGAFTPNAPSTAVEKARLGRQNSRGMIGPIEVRPLVNTGTLASSINHEVVIGRGKVTP